MACHNSFGVIGVCAGDCINRLVRQRSGFLQLQRTRVLVANGLK
ncbi:hypothetical protein Nizo2535_2451 [Lactiplantibacillus plantarum]|nr:hypothetical protein HMPREF0531_13108 [Lactiplantibacillus plantarum subsp. plantarum ATCC 14917 = JCM 1149 = CGMCC 1.2437]KPN84300.1 hypothetical protein Nizo2877_1233 [Lactiplantibacillus plantarum]KZU09519.1 hypothetical protein Nizo2263_1135 [Lactiplantibacillus plantarum]KZU17041.1 hypothetical protein Nizo2457_1778 [Lactiplantibacillus plantarum]KZU27829.1 hypothetical protein Nizo2535_2451 [Lactiplantibacillus plantarum]